jgi:hypothetical protein
MHTGLAAHAVSAQIIETAKARGVPVISSKQLLTWLDARNASAFGGLTWTAVSGAPQGGRTLSFTINDVAGATGLQAMLPLRLTGGVGLLTSVLRNGAAVTFDVKTLKGVEYAVFTAVGGVYAANYDTTAPDTTFSSTPPGLINSGDATFQFTATEAGSTFQCRLDAAAFAACTSPVSFTGLGTGSHTFQVRASDGAGNTDASPASHTWSVDVTAPTITSRAPSPNATGVPTNTAVTVLFTEAMASSSINSGTLRLRKAGAGSDLAATVTVNGASATLTPASPLLLGGQYQATVAGTVTDVAGNALGADVVWTFTTTNSLTDSTVADFSAGTADANARVVQAADGEVALADTAGSEFAGATLPAGWSSTQWTSGGTANVGSGSLSVNGTRVSPTADYTAGRSLEFVATFGTDGYQHVGFGLTFNETPWAIFSTFGGSGLYARTHNGLFDANTAIPGNWLNAPHRYRIDWNASSVDYYVDGTLVASHALAINVNMRPIVSDYLSSGSTLSVDWLRLTPYSSPAVFTSRIFDAAGIVNWATANWTADLPAGTSVSVSVRTGNTPSPDGTWSAFVSVSTPGGAVNQSGRYAQYRLQLSTSNPAQSPTVRDVTLIGIVP